MITYSNVSCLILTKVLPDGIIALILWELEVPPLALPVTQEETKISFDSSFLLMHVFDLSPRLTRSPPPKATVGSTDRHS